MLIVVEGGGSTVKVLATTTKEVENPRRFTLHRSGNALAVSDAEIEEIFRSISSELGGIEPGTVRLVIGMAGAGNPDQRHRLTLICSNIGYRDNQLTVLTDAELALKAISDRGLLVISGTGAVCIGKISNRAVRAGGWGYLIGADPGSGFHLGSLTLETLARTADGISQPSDGHDELYDAVIGHFKRKTVGVESLSDVRSYLYAAHFEKRRIADIASLVVDLAGAGNALAAELLGECVRALSELVVACCRKLGVAEQVELGLRGGLFRNPNSRSLVIEPLVNSSLLLPFRSFLLPVLLETEAGGDCMLTRAARHCF